MANIILTPEQKKQLRQYGPVVDAHQRRGVNPAR
jgi:hypothetical protein